MASRFLFTRALGILLPMVGAAGCGGDGGSGGGGEQTGQSCANATQCYANVTQPLQGGDAVCLQVQGGYCTHTCAADTDCCAVTGECQTGFPQVCSPFQSTNENYCFLSCEDGDVQHAGLTDAAQYCQTYASAAFTCRSTGGGASNRKVCAP